MALWMITKNLLPLVSRDRWMKRALIELHKSQGTRTLRTKLAIGLSQNYLLIKIEILEVGRF